MTKVRHLLWWRRWRRWRSKRSNEQHREATRAGLVMWCNTRELVERERKKEPSRVLTAWRLMMSIESNHSD